MPCSICRKSSHNKRTCPERLPSPPQASNPTATEAATPRAPSRRFYDGESLHSVGCSSPWYLANASARSSVSDHLAGRTELGIIVALLHAYIERVNPEWVFANATAQVGKGGTGLHAAHLAFVSYDTTKLHREFLEFMNSTDIMPARVNLSSDKVLEGRLRPILMKKMHLLSTSDTVKDFCGQVEAVCDELANVCDEYSKTALGDEGQRDAARELAHRLRGSPTQRSHTWKLLLHHSISVTAGFRLALQQEVFARALAANGGSKPSRFLQAYRNYLRQHQPEFLQEGDDPELEERTFKPAEELVAQVFPMVMGDLAADPSAMRSVVNDILLHWRNAAAATGEVHWRQRARRLVEAGGYSFRDLSEQLQKSDSLHSISDNCPSTLYQLLTKNSPKPEPVPGYFKVMCSILETPQVHAVTTRRLSFGNLDQP